MLYHLIYFSQSDKLMHDGNLLDILTRVKTLNRNHEITGMLLYMEGRFFSQIEGRFMQVLEGREQSVKDVFERIKNDKRHHDIIVLKQSPILTRSFASWSMGFKSINLEACKALPGYFNLDDDFLKSEELQQSDLPLNFLKSFYKINKKP